MSTKFPPVENIPADLLDAGFDAWDLLYQFYYRINEQMDKHQIKRTDIAARLGKSRSAISQLLNNNPNISLLKMAELAEAVGLELNFFYKDTLQETSAQDGWIHSDDVETGTDRIELHKAYPDNEVQFSAVSEAEVSYGA